MTRERRVKSGDEGETMRRRNRCPCHKEYEDSQTGSSLVFFSHWQPVNHGRPMLTASTADRQASRGKRAAAAASVRTEGDICRVMYVR